MSPSLVQVSVLHVGSFQRRETQPANSTHLVGLYGIQAARYYLEVHHDAKLVLLEADDVVGGTWSSSRIPPPFFLFLSLALEKSPSHLRCIICNSISGKENPFASSLTRRYMSMAHFVPTSRTDLLWLLDADSSQNGRIFRPSHDASTSGRSILWILPC